MHDYFEILGLPSDARASEVRHAWTRRVRRQHPDFPDSANADPLMLGAGAARPYSPIGRDVAVDFADVSAFLDRIQAAFFADTR